MLFDKFFAGYSTQNLTPTVCKQHMDLQICTGLYREEQTGTKNGHSGQKPFKSEVPNNERSVLLICCELGVPHPL